MNATTAAKARALAALHAGPGVLMLPNAWDAGSARLLAALPGVTAVATTSAGIAAAAGIQDGERLSLDAMLSSVAAICAAVDVPVTVDLEGGYGAEPAEVADAVGRVVGVGAVGVNLEDGTGPGADPLVDVGRHAAKIAAARQAGDRQGVAVVVNARTDTYLSGVGEESERFAETARRLVAYRDAGAGCLFVPGYPVAGSADAEADIRRLVDAVDGFPVNLLASPTLPSVERLSELGVRRVSAGSALYRAAMAAARDAALRMVGGDPRDAAQAGAGLPYAELARLLGGDHR
jgi:2-methylisocitrate lyase-like PEP mutase family enzyme